MTAGVAQTTSTPGAQPNRTTAESPNTKASETPLASRPSTGTRNRSASSEAPRKADNPARTVTPGVSVENEIAAAITVIRPATQTGATTGYRLRRAGGS